MPDAEQRANEGVSSGLHKNALARIDQNDGELCVGSAGHHVSGVLFVARRVGDDERSARRREETVGYVDGDALFALRFDTVQQ